MSAFTIRRTTESMTLLHRDRRSLRVAAAYRGADGFECLLDERVCLELERIIAEHSETEWMGVLSGRVMTDSRGHYVVVSGVVAADDIEATVGHVQCSKDEYRRMTRRLAATDPAGELVGWWHTHLGPGGFSMVDRAEQAQWTNPCSVGLLAMPGSPPDVGGLSVYRGPYAELLAYVDGFAHAERTCPSVPPVVSRAEAWPARRRPMGVAVVGVAAALVLSLIAVVLSLVAIAAAQEVPNVEDALVSNAPTALLTPGLTDSPGDVDHGMVQVAEGRSVATVAHPTWP